MSRQEQSTIVTFCHAPEDLNWQSEWKSGDDVLIHCNVNFASWQDWKSNGAWVNRTDYIVHKIEKLFPSDEVTSEEVELENLALVEKNNGYIK